MDPPLPSLLSRLQSAPNADAEALVDELSGDAVETPFQNLIRQWMNERHAPDILPTQDNLLSQLLDHIRKQVGECANLCHDKLNAECHSLTNVV
jgi:hypothetical protein